MIFVSLTRLRIRSIRFLPGFALQTTRAQRQIRHAPGFLDGALLADRDWTFWTLTAWNSQDDTRAYLISGDHKKAMPHLQHWCDEASVTHWTQPTLPLPTWPDADQRMRTQGRPSKVLHPSPHHADLTFRTPRTTTGGRIAPA